ncbi:MAG: polyprenyl synthetase family protein, partial [Anaerolineales bacterium]
GMVGAEEDRLTTLAAAIEMLHTATLVHDDLIDQASLRRGTPTLNAQWTPGATVLTGDYIFARAARLAARTGSLAVMESFAETLMTIVNGEITQLFGEDGITTRDEYFERIYAKTASLFELSTRGAGLLAAVDEDRLSRLEQFGYFLGVAFQIIDDVLDFVGDQERVGKPVAHDLRQGIVTLPTLYYLQNANHDGKVKKLIDGRSLDADAFDDLVTSIRGSGAIEASIDEAKDYIKQGLDHLQSMPSSPEKDALRDLAHYVVQRTV